MVDCDYFEVIDWDQDTNEIYHAVCGKSSACFPNCNSCNERVPYLLNEILEVVDQFNS